VIQKELYIIRHGQTDHNAKGIVQGKGVNLSLNETGRIQAQKFFNAYKHIPFDKLYASSLLRAQQSIDNFTQLGIPFEFRKELDEISWGEMEGTTTTLETDDSFKNMLADWKSGNIHAKYPQGESPYELQQRQLKFVEYLLNTSDKKILIATHGRFIRAFMCTLSNRPLMEMETFNHQNLCLYKVNYMADNSFSIDLNCDTLHL
jgi:broad specificity phosphatase PhoE